MSRARLAAAAAASALLLTGCWDVTSPEHILIPTLLAVDWKDGRYTTTIQAVAPALLSVGPGSGGGGGSSSATPPVRVLSGEGPSLLEAVRQASLSFPDPITLSHLQVVVLGRSVLAPRPFAGVMDTLLRTPFLVRTFWVFGAEGPAAPIAHAANPIGIHPADVLIRSSGREAMSARIFRSRFGRWAEDVVNAPSAVLLPVVTAPPAARPGTGEDFLFPTSYLIQGGRVVGTLTPDETAIWTVMAPVHGEDSPVLPTVPVVAGGTRYLFTLTAYRTRIRLTGAGLELRTTAAARLDEVDRAGGPPLARPPLHQTDLAQILARHLAGEELRLLDRSRRQGADILSVGRIAAAEQPAWFRAHRARWQDTLRRLTATVRVEVTLEGTGNLAGP